MGARSAHNRQVLACVETLPLVDHHCHGVLRIDVDRSGFEEMMTEAAVVSPLGTTLFDSGLGLAIRRWCAPVLDLPERAVPERYVARRAELGAAAVNERFLRAAGIAHFLVDTGFLADELTSPGELGRVAAARADEIVRLECVAEDVARGGVTAAGFADAVTAALVRRTRHAIACKSIAAYRVGLELSGARPTAAEVGAAAGRWLSEVDAGRPVRLADEVLHRFLIWQAIDTGLPIQIHVGYGDSDVDLHRADPLLLTDLLRTTRDNGVPIVLLHNYPFHRHAGYLAQVFEHVFIDVGLATHNLGHRAAVLLAETLELTPFGKFLFATDGCGLAELHYLGALLFRRGLSDFLHAGLDDGSWTIADAERISRLIGAANAQRVYRLDDRRRAAVPAADARMGR